MSNSNTGESRANMKSMSDEEIMQKIAELEEESDCVNLSIDDVYDSYNDVSYNPEDLSSDLLTYLLSPFNVFFSLYGV